MLESELKKKVLRMLKSEFPHVWFYKVSDKFCSGLPDIIMCFNGHLVGLELKRPGAKPRPLQVLILEKIRKAGGFAMCSDNLDQCHHFLADVQIATTL